MWTNKQELKTYQLKFGLTKIAVPPGSKVLDCKDLRLIVLQPTGVSATDELQIWAFGINEHVRDDLFAELDYLDTLFSSGHVTGSVWRDRRYPARVVKALAAVANGQVGPDGRIEIAAPEDRVELAPPPAQIDVDLDGTGEVRHGGN